MTQTPLLQLAVDASSMADARDIVEKVISTVVREIGDCLAPVAAASPSGALRCG